MLQFIYSYIALEWDMLSSARFKRVVCAKDDHDAGAGPTRLTSSAEKAIRAACQNQMVVASVFYTNHQNKLCLRMVVRVCRPIMLWYEQQSRELRSASASLEWSLRQQCGEFMASCCATLSTLRKQSDLQWIGFTMPASKAKGAECDPVELAQQHDLASAMGHLALSLLGCRLRRQLWLLRGWPGVAVKFLAEKSVAAAMVKLLRADQGNFLRFAYKSHEDKHISIISKRSLFRLVTVQQIWSMMDSEGFAANGKVQDWVRKRFSRVICSQIDEDAFNRQKNFGQKGYSSHYSKPERSMSIPIVKRVLSTVHHYQEIEPSYSAETQGRRLAKECFVPKGEPQGWKSAQVVTKTSTPPWFSPSAENLGIVHADLELMAEVVKNERWGDLGNAWLSCVVSSWHCMVMRRCDVSESPWLFGLTNFGSTAALFWPAGVQRVKKGFSVARPSCQNRDLCLYPVLSLDDWEAWRFDWRSPAELSHEFGKAAVAQGLCVEAVLLGNPAPLLQIVAECGFFTLGKSALDCFCGHLGVNTGGVGVRVLDGRVEAGVA